MSYYNYPSSSSSYPYYSSSSSSSTSSSPYSSAAYSGYPAASNPAPPASAAPWNTSSGPWTLQPASSHGTPKLHKILIGVVVGVVIFVIVIAVVLATRGSSSSSSGGTSGTGGSGNSGCDDADSEGASGGGGGGGLSGGMIALIVIFVLFVVGVLVGLLSRRIWKSRAKSKKKKTAQKVFEQQKGEIKRAGNAEVEGLKDAVKAILENKGMADVAGNREAMAKIERAIARTTLDIEIGEATSENLGQKIMAHLQTEDPQGEIKSDAIQVVAQFLGSHMGATKVPKPKPGPTIVTSWGQQDKTQTDWELPDAPNTKPSPDPQGTGIPIAPSRLVTGLEKSAWDNMDVSTETGQPLENDFMNLSVESSSDDQSTADEKGQQPQENHAYVDDREELPENLRDLYERIKDDKAEWQDQLDSLIKYEEGDTKQKRIANLNARFVFHAVWHILGKTTPKEGNDPEVHKNLYTAFMGNNGEDYPGATFFNTLKKGFGNKLKVIDEIGEKDSKFKSLDELRDLNLSDDTINKIREVFTDKDESKWLKKIISMEVFSDRFKVD